MPIDFIERSATRSTYHNVKNLHVRSRDVFRVLPESPEKLRLVFERKPQMVIKYETDIFKTRLVTEV